MFYIYFIADCLLQVVAAFWSALFQRAALPDELWVRRQENDSLVVRQETNTWRFLSPSDVRDAAKIPALLKVLKAIDWRWGSS